MVGVLSLPGKQHSCQQSLSLLAGLQTNRDDWLASLFWRQAQLRPFFKFKKIFSAVVLFYFSLFEWNFQLKHQVNEISFNMQKLTLTLLAGLHWPTLWWLVGPSLDRSLLERREITIMKYKHSATTITSRLLLVLAIVFSLLPPFLRGRFLTKIL